MDEEPDQYATLCTISANTGHLKRTFREDPAREKTNGKDKGPEPENEKGQEKEKDAKKGTIYKIDFGIVLSFGLTELKAQLIWMDDGIEHRCVHNPWAYPRCLKPGGVGGLTFG